MDKPAPITRRVRYRGRVQGVGFRLTAASFAKRHKVNGYVKNLSDGTVEMVVHESPERVDEMLSGLQEHFSGNIEESRIDELPAGDTYVGFEIRH